MALDQTTQFDKLTALHRAQFARAATLQYSILYVQIAIAALGALAAFSNNEKLNYAASLLTFGLVVSWLVLFLKYKDKRDVAERLRRATLVTGGLGVILGKEEFCELMLASGLASTEINKYRDLDYYATTGTGGPEKLAGMLCQSSFFSAYLLQKSGQLYWSICIFSFLIFGGTFLAALPVADGNVLMRNVRFACSFATLLVSTDLLGAAIEYSSAAVTVRSIIQRLRLAKAGGYSQQDMLMIVGDYNAAVEGSPMFPPGVYSHFRMWLNEMWEQSDSYEPPCK